MSTLRPRSLDVPVSEEPFVEHPTGEFESAVEAMADAIMRLRALPKWDAWITFEAQGMGPRVDSYQFATIRMLGGEIRLGAPPPLNKRAAAATVDVRLVTQRAGVKESGLAKSDSGYSLANATPLEAARIMDVIFREYLGIRPHPDQDNDYAVGAEW